MSPPKVNAINNELLSQNLESGVSLVGDGEMLVSTIEVADGSVWFFEPASKDTAEVRVELYGVSDETWQTIKLVSADQGHSVYMPEGDYIMVTYSTGGDYQISIYYQPTNVVAGSPLRQSPVEVYDTWDYQEVKTYPIYLSGKKDWRLKFLEANNNQYLNFCIRYSGGSTIGCPSEEHSGSRSGMPLDSTESDIPPGWYELEVAALEPDDGANYPYSSSWAIYETEAGVQSHTYGNSIGTPDGFEYALIPEKQFWLNTSGMPSYSLQLDCSYDLWIYTNNLSPGWNYSWTNSGLKYSADDCTSGSSYLTLSLDPDENGEVNFGLHLRPPPPPLTVMIGDQYEEDLSNEYPLAMNEGSYNFQVELNRPLQDGEYLDVRVTVDLPGYESWANLEEVDPSGWMYLDSRNGTTRTFSLKVHDDGTPGQIFGDPNLAGWGWGDICFDIYHDDPNVEKSWCNMIDFIDMSSP
jgi:hypothetical protein